MTIIHYNSNLKKLAAQLRTQSTQSEAILWQELRGRKLNGFRFVRQKPIGNYIVDFYCKESCLIIELDGLSHHFEETMDKDEIKQHFLESLGFKVLRFEDEEVIKDLANVIRVIEYNLKS